MVIDFHTHCFPDKLAERAVGQLSRVGGGLMPYSDGTLDGLRRQMAQHNIDISVVLNIATKPEQQTNVNNFASNSCECSIGLRHRPAPRQGGPDVSLRSR